MKLRPAISIGQTAVPPPPKLTISYSAFLRRVHGSTSPQFAKVVISPRNACCFIVRRSFNSDSTVEPAKEDQNFDENKIVDKRVSYELDWALSNLGFVNFPLIVLAYAGLGWIAEAMEMMLLSFVGPIIQPEWGLSSEQESFISTVTFGGMLVGSYAWGVVSDSYGRKKGFLGASVMTTTCGLLSAFAPNYTSLLILRFFIGVGLGCGHVFSSWFLEFVPAPKRGTWMVVFSTFWTIGTIIEASLAWSVMPSFGWRWLLGLSTIPSLLVLLFYGQVPESPSLYTNVFVNSLAELPGLGLAAIILDKLGRKISMELMFVVAFVLLLPLVFYDQNDLLTTTSLFGARMFISASFIVACIYSPEVYPTNIRATGVGIATAVGRIGGMVCPLVAVGLVNSCSQTLAVMLFEAMILVSGLCVVLLPLETKGRDLTDEVE